MTVYSFNFRSTAGSWGETSPAVAILGDLYTGAALANGVVAGWSIAPGSKADYASASNAKLSGRNLTNNAGVHFRIDLPNGPGTYRIWIAAGALSTTTTTAFALFMGAQTTAYATVAATSVASGNVMDASGAVITTATYIASGGTYIEFTTTENYIRVERNGTNMYINNIQLEPQVSPLGASVLSDEHGDTTHSGTIWAQEPAGKIIGKVTAATGAQSFAVQGAAATYFTVETRGSTQYLVTTSTRIPNGWSGNVVIRQTSGVDTYDTTFALTATAITRPLTGILGQVTSETIFQRQRVLTVMQEAWPGYQGQAFASDVTVTSAAGLASAISGLAPDGTSWYRIRVRNGTYAGTTHSVTNQNFGNGGLLIEPDAGHDPVVQAQFNNFNLRKCHIRNLILVPPTSVGATPSYVFNHGITGGGFYPNVLISDCRIGYNFMTSPPSWDQWGYFTSFEFVEQYQSINNRYSGIGLVHLISGGRIMRFLNDDARNVVIDFHALSPAFRLGTPRGVFADDKTYVQIDGVTHLAAVDAYTGLSTGATPHADFFQIRRLEKFYSYQAYPNGNTSARWAVGDVTLNLAEGRRYTVASTTTAGGATAGVASGPGPSGTGTGIVTGGVVWDYAAPYNLATEFLVLIENTVSMLDGLTINAAGNASPGVQWFINSNGGTGNTNTLIQINNICGSNNVRGIEAGSESVVHAEFNTFCGPAETPDAAGGPSVSQITAGVVRARRNIVGRSGGQPQINSWIKTAVQDGNIGVDFTASSPAGSQPPDHMRGTFTRNSGGSGSWGYSTLQDDLVVSKADFRSAISKQLHHIAGTVGARLEEKHTITLSDGTNTVTGNIKAKA